MTTDAWSFVSPAAKQTMLPAEFQLNSANAGVIIVRSGQVRNLYRHEGRVFAREVSEFINLAQAGVATVLNFEEVFGTQDRIYWLIHMKTLDDYVKLLKMGKEDERFQAVFLKERIGAEKGYGKWDKMFVDASFHEMVLTAHHWGTHGTALAEKKEKTKSVLAPASEQVRQADDKVLHTGNAGAIILRSGQVKGEFRSEGREFARDVVEYINEHQEGVATTVLYEEHFGRQDRIHWVTHMRTLGDYHALCAMGSGDDRFREIFVNDRVASDKGGGDWSALFVDSSIEETLVMPQHPLKGC